MIEFQVKGMEQGTGFINMGKCVVGIINVGSLPYTCITGSYDTLEYWPTGCIVLRIPLSI